MSCLLWDKTDSCSFNPPPPPGPVKLPMFGIHLISLKETFSKLHKLARVKREIEHFRMLVQFEVWSELNFFKILHNP